MVIDFQLACQDNSMGERSLSMALDTYTQKNDYLLLSHTIHKN